MSPTEHSNETTIGAGRRTPAYVKRLLGGIGKFTVLNDVRKNCQQLTPNEMVLSLDPQATAGAVEDRLSRLARWLSGTRNALVVVPLMITWLSLGLAAEAYQQFVQHLQLAPDQTAPPFFQAWQEGFPGIASVRFGAWTIAISSHGSSWFTFSGVAFADFLLIALLLVLTVLAEGVELFAHWRAQRLRSWLEEELHILGKASFAWAWGPGLEKKPRWAIDVQEAMNALNQVMANVDESVGRAVKNFEGSLDRQRDTITHFVEETADVSKTVNELKKFYQFTKETYESLRDLLPGIAGQVEEMGSNQQVEAQAWNEMVKHVNATITYLAQIIDVLQRAGFLEQARQFPPRRPAGPRTPNQPRPQYAPYDPRGWSERVRGGMSGVLQGHPGERGRN